MDSIARLPAGERAQLFQDTGARTKLAATLVEKDFWVCWTLGQLFDIPELKDVLMFKGGTALSKVFKLIERFSEDIDLAVDYAPLGFVGDRDPREEMSRTRREALLKEMMASCRGFVEGPVLDAIRARCRHVLGKGRGWSAELSEMHPNTIEFAYPSSGIAQSSYVSPRILLELGTHAELIPSGSYSISSFVAEQFPEEFKIATSRVRAIKAERTFWEKATILHVERHRPLEKPLPVRHARHYFDLAMLARSAVGASAVADPELLRRVVEHKTKFYYSGWARYDLAVPGTLSLLPAENRLGDLRTDYEAMSAMIFGDRPPFDALLSEIAHLEARINQARPKPSSPAPPPGFTSPPRAPGLPC